MKAIKIINTIAIGTPFALFLIDLVVQGGLSIFALLSTMFTGFVQVILGILLLMKFPKYIHYQIYLIGVVGYFVLWYISNEFELQDVFAYFLFSIPPCLALYLSVLIYKLPNHEL